VHGQTFDLQLGDGDEVLELAATGTQLGGIEGDRDPSEGQRERAATRYDLRAVLRGERRGERPVVQVCRAPEARIERTEARTIFRKEKRVGVERGREVVRALVGLFGVEEREPESAKITPTPRRPLTTAE